jgi:hypothetical protein
MQFGKSAGQTVLHEIVGGDEVMRQRAGIAPKAGNFTFDLPARVGHKGYS